MERERQLGGDSGNNENGGGFATKYQDINYRYTFTHKPFLLL